MRPILKDGRGAPSKDGGDKKVALGASPSAAYCRDTPRDFGVLTSNAANIPSSRGTHVRVSGAPNGLQLSLQDGLHNHSAAVIGKASALINRSGP